MVQRFHLYVQVKLNHITQLSPPFPPCSSFSFSLLCPSCLAPKECGKTPDQPLTQCPSTLEVKSLLVRKAFNQVCMCFLFLLSGFKLFLPAIVRVARVTLGIIIKYMCFSVEFLFFSALIYTWKLVKHNSPFPSAPLALSPTII